MKAVVSGVFAFLGTMILCAFIVYVLNSKVTPIEATILFVVWYFGILNNKKHDTC